MTFTYKDKDNLFGLLERQLQVLIWIHNLQVSDSEYTASSSHIKEMKEVQEFLDK